MCAMGRSKKRVLPEVSQESHVISWIDKLVFIVTSYEQTGKPPNQHSLGGRILMYSCLPISCFPCLAWSILWRCISCPGQCIINGPGYMCSDNGCTECSDVCVEACAKDAGAYQILGPIPNTEKLILSETDKLRLNQIVGKLESIFAGVASPGTYQLAESLFCVTPVHVNQKLIEVRQAFGL